MPKPCNRTNSGEATVAFQEWWQLGRKLHDAQGAAQEQQSTTTRLPQKKPQITSISIAPEPGLPRILAADPVRISAFDS
ncbi:hypothetical protein H0H87_004604 [Tephrocybe sp. NHM501043]|nr:hypothetical protein H0H87_004604 [Tephrocybe sp. NHM501043]